MDPGATQEWKDQITGRLSGHESQMAALANGIHEITRRLEAMSLSQKAPASVTVQQVREPCIATPERYGGDSASCETFLTQCEIQFAFQPSSYPSEESKVAYVISLLTGRAAQWAVAQWGNKSHVCSSYQQFSAELREVFDPIKPHQEAAYQLTHLRQGNESVDDFAIRFRTLAAKSKWNQHALFDMFHQGLSDRIKDELAARELPSAINDLISVASRIDRRIRESNRERSQRLRFPNRGSSPRWPTGPSLPPPRPEEEPMQLGRTQLSQQERDRRSCQNLCFYCASPSHHVQSCPVKDAAQHERRGRV